MKRILAIDPGKKGAIVCRYGTSCQWWKMPDSCRDLHDVISAAVEGSASDAVCYLEQVRGIPGMGGSSMFTFGQNFGNIEQCLIDLGIKTIKVTPQRWQKMFGVGSSSIKDPAVKRHEHKVKLKQRAQELFPDCKVTLVNCDALLISEYGCKHEQQNM